MTTYELREKFEKRFSYLNLSKDDYGNYYVLETFGYWWGYQDAHASRDAEVEALKRHVGNVVRQMKNCASDVSNTPSLNGQWVADTINWFADEIGIDATMREENK